jgi:hypothetical protein
MIRTGNANRLLILFIVVIVASLAFACGEAEKQAGEQPKLIVCPACGGAGKVERANITPGPPGMPGNVSYSLNICGVCAGKGKIVPVWER